MNEFRVIQKQYPVGQGGLHLTQLIRNSEQNHRFSFVYDCGGMGSPTALKRQMSMLRNALRVENGNRHIDLMAISHLHRDHINGFEMLVGATSLRIGTLLLPHYDEIDIALILASAAADGATLSELTTIDDALRNSERYFRERGVQQIRFVAPDEGEGGDSIAPEPPDLPEGGTIVSETGWVLKFVPSGTKSTVTRVVLINSQTGAKNAAWQFLPYARRQTPSTSGHRDRLKLKSDIESLLKKFGGGLKPLNFPQQNAKDVIAGLVNAYKYYFLERSWNPISLTLASGTTYKWCDFTCMCIRDYCFSGWPIRHDAAKGLFWMHTGDAVLCGSDGSAWSKYFNSILPLVKVFQAPHHGSRKNLDVTTVAKLLSHCDISYATCRNNDPKHPHPNIRQDLNSHGLELLEITQYPHSEFVTLTVFWS